MLSHKNPQVSLNKSNKKRQSNQATFVTHIPKKTQTTKQTPKLTTTTKQARKKFWGFFSIFILSDRRYAVRCH